MRCIHLGGSRCDVDGDDCNIAGDGWNLYCRHVETSQMPCPHCMDPLNLPNMWQTADGYYCEECQTHFREKDMAGLYARACVKLAQEHYDEIGEYISETNRLNAEIEKLRADGAKLRAAMTGKV